MMFEKNKRKIVFFEANEMDCAKMKSLSCDHDVIFVQEALSQENISLYLDADIISGFISTNLSYDILKQFRNLKFIATRSTGFDHIDLKYCNENNIQVSNIPVYGDNTIAEHAFALILAISHNIPESVDRTKQGNFSREGLQGFDLKNKTIGIVGLGNIGKCTAQMARGFSMNILVYDLYQDQEFAKEFGVRYVSLAELLKSSDIISLHIPGGEKNHHFISDQEFSQMKQGVTIINTARGDIIDVKALIRALDGGIVSFAALDVLEEEAIIHQETDLLNKKHDPEILLANQALLKMENVIVTAHNAFNTKEALQRILDTTIDNIAAFCNGRPNNIINNS